MSFGSRVFYKQIGPGHSPRFVICNSDDAFWTGNGWNTEQMAALLFHDEYEAAGKAKSMDEGIQRRCFTTTIRVAVECEDDFSLDELRAYLGLHASISLDCPDVESVLNAAWIDFDADWDVMQEG